MNSEPPKVIIDHKHLAIVSCHYDYKTCTENDIGVTEAIVSGYFPLSLELETFKLDFKSNQATKLIL